MLSPRQKDVCTVGANCKGCKYKEIVSKVKGDQRNQLVPKKSGERTTSTPELESTKLNFLKAKVATNVPQELEFCTVRESSSERTVDALASPNKPADGEAKKDELEMDWSPCSAESRNTRRKTKIPDQDPKHLEGPTLDHTDGDEMDWTFDSDEFKLNDIRAQKRKNRALEKPRINNLYNYWKSENKSPVEIVGKAHTTPDTPSESGGVMEVNCSAKNSGEAPTDSRNIFCPVPGCRKRYGNGLRRAGISRHIMGQHANSLKKTSPN